MSEILSEEIVDVIRARKTTLAGIKCDCCEKIVPARSGYVHENEYYDVTTGHHEWGNDSCDSIEDYDICPDCIGRFVTDYLNKTGYASAYIEVERRHVYPSDRWLN